MNITLLRNAVDRKSTTETAARDLLPLDHDIETNMGRTAFGYLLKEPVALSSMMKQLGNFCGFYETAVLYC